MTEHLLCARCYAREKELFSPSFRWRTLGCSDSETTYVLASDRKVETQAGNIFLGTGLLGSGLRGPLSRPVSSGERQGSADPVAQGCTPGATLLGVLQAGPSPPQPPHGPGLSSLRAVKTRNTSCSLNTDQTLFMYLLIYPHRGGN